VPDVYFHKGQLYLYLVLLLRTLTEYLLTCICLTARYFIWLWSPHKFVTSRCGGVGEQRKQKPTAVTSRCGGVGEQRKQKPTAVTSLCGRGRGIKKTKANRCGVCYSTVLNAHRVTSIANTDIDAVRKQKKAEYDKRYRLKRKLYCNSKLPKTYTWSGTFILKDGRYTFFFKENNKLWTRNQT
jgi:hypothetical protein